MMNGRHLPAGQGVHADMGRRRHYNHNPNHHHSQHQHQHQHQHQQQQQHHHQPQQHHSQYPPPGQMYNGYVPMYAPGYYPQQQQLPPQYYTTPIPQQYPPYAPHVRSPPPPPPAGHYLQQQASFSQSQLPGPQPSPAVVPVYQPPPPPTPTSTLSSHTLTVSETPPSPLLQTAVLPGPPSPALEGSIMPFRAPLPWLSAPEAPWPTRRFRSKRRQAPKISLESVKLPVNQQLAGAAVSNDGAINEDTAAPRPETPSTNRPTSEENDSTHPTTPSSAQNSNNAIPGDATPVAAKVLHKPTLSSFAVLPAMPKFIPQPAAKPSSEKSPETLQQPEAFIEENNGEDARLTNEISAQLPEVVAAPKAWTTPKQWAGLFSPISAVSGTQENTGSAAVTSSGKPNAETLSEALRSFSPAATDTRVAFLEPRGLVNTGNMCYMNSVLQVLVFCIPFYSFLDLVSKRAAHSFKSETPLIDAMIMFMREYPVMDSASSPEKLKLRLKERELEQYGEQFSPDFVYDAINRLPRFVTMRRGHQQDAEEFLGFLLEGLHEECVQIMRSTTSNNSSTNATPAMVPSSPISSAVGTASTPQTKENGWLEVGPKQKASVTRSSGTIVTSSPITKIFGGNLRSELRVPGLKDSVTLEPYQPLQLDIGAPNVHNIIDALKGLTHSEVLHGDFRSPKGPNVTATKQVFIESVPPVLILHLKRFQYDNTGGTQKIWKKVGYPLELEIPKEVFPRQQRAKLGPGGLPKYRLTAVVYHHGKNASGGHYTVDVRRQEGQEWIRLDDTVIRRVRSEDVAEGGSEEDPKVLAAAIEAHKKDKTASENIFASIEENEDSNAEEGWKQAGGAGKKWSSVVNGASTPKTKNEKSSVRDNKVAYLLFYQKLSPTV